MPDISLCTSKGCPKWHLCFRAQSVPSKWRQSFSAFPFGENGCSYFWPIEERGKKTVFFEADEDEGPDE